MLPSGLMDDIFEAHLRKLETEINRLKTEIADIHRSLAIQGAKVKDYPRNSLGRIAGVIAPVDQGPLEQTFGPLD